MTETIEPVEDEVFEQLLSQDPLLMAQEVTGLTVDEDGGTADLGLWVAGMHHSALERQLRARGDTLFRDTLERYQTIIREYGFEEVLCIPYVYDDGPNELYVYFHPSLGALLVFHTHDSYLVEGAALYFQWRANDDTTFYPTGSGFLVKDRWMGHFDAREALIFRLRRFKQHGKFLTPWERFDGWPDISPWIVHPGDGKIENPEEFEKLVNKRLAMLPLDVQEAIGAREPTWS
jgi:hypothetical protein